MGTVCEITLGGVEPIGGEYRNASGALVTGSTTIVLSIRRASDGQRLDFSTMLFSASPVAATHVLTETPVASGFYLYNLDTSVLAAGQSYLVRVDDTAAGAVLDGLGGELRVRGVNALSVAVAALPSAAATTAEVWNAGTRTLSSGAITSGTFADGAITAPKVAADALGAAQISAAAVAKIQSGLALVTTVTTGVADINAHTDIATAPLATSTELSSAVAGLALQSDLNDIKGTSFSTSTDSLRALRARGDAAWTTATGFAAPGAAMTLTSGERTAVGTTVWATTTRALTEGVTLAAFDPAALDVLVSGVWSEALAGYTAGQAGYLLAGAGGSDPAVIAAAVVNRAIAGSSAGSVGAALLNLDGTITSRLATSGYTAPPSAASIAATVLQSAVPAGFAQGTLGYVVGASLARPGDAMNLESLAIAQIVTNVWGNGYGALLTTRLDATVSSRASSANVTSAVTSINTHTDEATGTLATSAALATAQSAINAIPADLATAHGAGSWATATGFAVAGDAMVLTSGERTAIGASVWSSGTRALTADVTLGAGAITSSVFTQGAADLVWGSASRSITSIAAGAITAAALASDAAAEITASVWSADLSNFLAGTAGYLLASSGGVSPSAVAAEVWAAAEAWGSYGEGTFGHSLALLRMGLTNRLEYTPGTPGLLRLYQDGGLGVLLTWTELDFQGTGVAGQAGAPARRGEAT